MKPLEKQAKNYRNSVRLLRQGFYLLLGMSFPAFWIFHASGFWAVLYRPIQLLSGTNSTGWPSCITAALLYLVMIVAFECISRVLKNAHP